MNKRNLAELTSELVILRDTHGLKKIHNPKDLALSLVVEATDILEHFQWQNPNEGALYVQVHRKELADQLVILMNYILLMAHDYKIDIGKEVDEKIKDNSMKYPFKAPKVRYTKI